jgi:peptide/nickel transport system substrate-binding protein
LKRFFLGLFLIGIALAAWAEKIPEGGTITIAVYDDPAVLNPLYAPEGAANVIINFFTDSLLLCTPDGVVIPDLAESWEVSPDGLTWTFHLRRGVRFTDGSECTAEDVAFTYQEGSDPKYGLRNADFAQVASGVHAEDRYTFQVFLRKPYGLLPAVLGRGIVPAHSFRGDKAAEAAFDRHPIGTGPFELGTWEPGRLVFEANTDYFMGRPHLDRVIFTVFEDDKKSWVSLTQGTTDLVAQVDYEDYLLMKNDARFATHSFLDDFCSSLLLNNRDPLFSSRRMRQAVSAAIDRRDLIDTVLAGRGMPANGPFKPGTWACNPDLSLQAFDPAKASRILSELGWKDTNGDLILDMDGVALRFTTLIYQGDRLEEAAAKRLQWQLLQVGIRMDVEALPVQDLIEKRMPHGAFQAALVPFNTYSDPDFPASRFWASASIGSWNVTGYSNREVDRLIDEGRRTTDVGVRAPIYQKMFALIADDAPAAFLYYRNKYTAAISRLKGIEPFGISFSGIFAASWYLESP